jgi:hypothetical protein
MVTRRRSWKGWNGRVELASTMAGGRKNTEEPDRRLWCLFATKRKTQKQQLVCQHPSNTQEKKQWDESMSAVA